MYKTATLFIFLCLTLLACDRGSDVNTDKALHQETQPVPDTKEERPNIVLIVVDDMGFNDLGIFGGEINTPNMDALARNGIAFTNFHSAATCSPTRAMLLSGTDNHIAGLGSMAEEQADNQKGRPGYEGFLNLRVAALPELLQDAGYHTYMTGKWHLGLTAETSPAARGFDKSFAMLQGGAGAFSNRLQLMGPHKAKYREDGRTVDSLPDDFYSTRFYTERMIEYIETNRQDGKPFFSYLAYTAPHWPLQAPEESIARYRGKYDEGYDVLKQRRLERLKELGLFDNDIAMFPSMPAEPRWEELTPEQQRYEARKMEIYAAMIDDIDVYIGELITYLKNINEYDNTFIFFMSDNGPEAHDLLKVWPDILSKYLKSCCDNSYDNLGKANSYIWYGPNWGQAGNVPLRMFKGYPGQGGIRVPAFLNYSKANFPDRQYDGFLTVMDVMPTLLELAGVVHPGAQYKGRNVEPIKGKSILPVVAGKTDAIHPADYVVGWELFAKRAIRQGDWKIIYIPDNPAMSDSLPAEIKTGTWQLYNLNEDPTEQIDLSTQYPDKLTQMIKLWGEYVETNGVVLPDEVSGY